MMSVPNPFLERIAQSKRERVERDITGDPSLEKIRRRVQEAPPPSDFYQALSHNNYLSLIAEIKRASPSRGIMRADLDPASQAQEYQDYGASALSVITEEDHFHGSLEDLADARKACTLPILRKDFIFHPYQVFESRAYGADAILLIAAILPEGDLSKLTRLAVELGMHPVVEIHTEEEIPAALRSGARIIGINNRDLATFRVDLETTARLAHLIPKDRLIVSESGIRGAEEAKRASSFGARAVLVGEALVTSLDLALLMHELTRIPAGS